MKKMSDQQKKILREIIVVVLSVLFIISLLWLISSVKELRQSGELQINHIPKNHSGYPYNEISVNNITTWMTFDYINVVFRLDPFYLKNILMINDPRYPNIQIERYAKNHNMNSQFLLNNIRQAIINYPNSRL